MCFLHHTYCFDCEVVCIVLKAPQLDFRSGDSRFFSLKTVTVPCKMFTSAAFALPTSPFRHGHLQ